MTVWPTEVIDTDPHPRFRLYSSGNFGEVAPDRLSVMSWSLVGVPSERGFRALVERFWPGATWHRGSHHTFVGYFAGKPYHNLAALGHLAAEVPLVEAEDLAALYFEGVPVPPRERRGAPRPLATAALVARILREFTQLRSWLVGVGAQVAAIESDARAALADGAPARVGAVVERARAVLGETWSLHMANTTWLVPAHATQRAVARRALGAWDEDVAAWLNRPQELVWGSLYAAAAIDLPAGPGAFLDHAFYEVADDREPFGSLAIRHRVRRADPGDGAARAGGRDPLPADVAKPFWDIAPRLSGSLLRALTRGIGDGMEAREASKALAMRCLHVFRLLVPPLAESRGVADEDWPYLTLDELCERPATALAGLAEERRSAFEAGVAIEMPALLDLGGGRSVQDAVAGGGAPRPARRGGRGVSPGTADGIAVTPESIDRFGADEPLILVCESADADVEPLLPRVRGLVSARGSVLSHVAILVREHGLPGVVGHPLAYELQPGTPIAIDGASGEVHVREDAP